MYYQQKAISLKTANTFCYGRTIPISDTIMQCPKCAWFALSHNLIQISKRIAGFNNCMLSSVFFKLSIVHMNQSLNLSNFSWLIFANELHFFKNHTVEWQERTHVFCTICINFNWLKKTAYKTVKLSADNTTNKRDNINMFSCYTKCYCATNRLLLVKTRFSSLYPVCHLIHLFGA